VFVVELDLHILEELRTTGTLLTPPDELLFELAEQPLVFLDTADLVGFELLAKLPTHLLEHLLVVTSPLALIIVAELGEATVKFFLQPGQVVLQLIFRTDGLLVKGSKKLGFERLLELLERGLRASFVGAVQPIL